MSRNDFIAKAINDQPGTMALGNRRFSRPKQYTCNKSADKYISKKRNMTSAWTVHNSDGIQTRSATDTVFEFQATDLTQSETKNTRKRKPKMKKKNAKSRKVLPTSSDSQHALPFSGTFFSSFSPHNDCGWAITH